MLAAARSSRRPSRWLMGTLSVATAFLLAPAGVAWAADGGLPVPVPPSTGLTDNGVGAVSAADRAFVLQVRLAGLWEVPAGNMAVERSEDPRIVGIGKAIAAQHVVLDKLDVAVAKRLGMSLPNQPNSDQAGWLDEMRNARTSRQFDQIYVDRLRAAHGKIFPAVAAIRAGTRNDSVRKLAQQTNQFVMTHMTLLESSGLVDYGSLPTLPSPTPAAGGGPVPVDNEMLMAARESGVPGGNPRVVLLVLAGALLSGVLAAIRIFRTR